jgi:hypothetical protein
VRRVPTPRLIVDCCLSIATRVSRARIAAWAWAVAGPAKREGISSPYFKALKAVSRAVCG